MSRNLQQTQEFLAEADTILIREIHADFLADYRRRQRKEVLKGIAVAIPFCLLMYVAMYLILGAF